MKYDMTRERLVEQYLTNHKNGMEHLTGKKNGEIIKDKNVIMKIR